MTKPECAKLLKEVAAIDNRTMTQETLDAWFSIIGYLSYDVAVNALRLARKDDRIAWLEPKHIVSWAREAKERLDRENNSFLEEAKNDVFGPVPYCIHGEVIAMCLPCCREAAEVG